MALRQRHLFDWRFLAALAMVMAVTYIIVSGITAQVARNREHLADQAQVKALTAQITALQLTQERTSRLFGINQSRMLDYTAASAARQAAELRYMRAHGLAIPQAFLTPIPPPRLLKTAPRHHSTSGSTLRHKRHSSGSPKKATGPGRSGKHGKGHGHGHHPHFRRHGHRGHHGR